MGKPTTSNQLQHIAMEPEGAPAKHSPTLESHLLNRTFLIKQ